MRSDTKLVLCGAAVAVLVTACGEGAGGSADESSPSAPATDASSAPVDTAAGPDYCIDGELERAGSAYPSGYPSDDVPLVDHQVMAPSPQPESANEWEVWLSNGSDPERAFDRALTCLEASGFTVDGEAREEELLEAEASSDSFEVSLLAERSGLVVRYAVRSTG